MRIRGNILVLILILYAQSTDRPVFFSNSTITQTQHCKCLDWSVEYAEITGAADVHVGLLFAWKSPCMMNGRHTRNCMSPGAWRMPSKNSVLHQLRLGLLSHVAWQWSVASPGFVARRGKDRNYVMGHSRWTSGAAAAWWLIVLWLMQYWLKELWVVDICII